MISQYIETNSGTTPKGIEVFNYSAVTIDFSATPLEVFKGANGAVCANDVTISTGLLQPGEVWVIGTTDLITDAANNGANLSGTTDHGFTFNGDDALELYLGGTLMDVIGTCGSDPGSAWSGNGVSTADQNIQIINGICTGTTSYWTDPSLRFETASSTPSSTGGTVGFGDAPTCTSNTITTTSVSSLTFNIDCSTDDTGTVDFTSTGTFNTGNIFTAQLSDVAGSFTSPINIGTLTLDGPDPSGTVNLTIPAGTASGTGYRIRVISDSPNTTGSDNGSDIEITYSPCTISTNTLSSLTYGVDCSNSDAGNVDFTSSGTFNAGNTFSAELSDASGDFTTPTTIGSMALDGSNPSGNISFTIPAGTASGTGYKLRVVSDAPAIIGTESTGNIEITNTPCTVTIDNLSSLYYQVDCDNSDIGNLDFSSNGDFNTGNTFTVELSDASGDFTSATSIGSLVMDGTNPSGNIDFTIPAGTPNGIGYRIRIVSDDPNVVGADNGSDIEIVYTVCPSTLPSSGGLLINEFSNGSTGSQEFYEFIVAGQCGETVDVRGYIIDDNNGTFTADYNNPGGTGIADGHLRLTNDAQWADIPVGSVIVVYNDGDPNTSLPADDPYDSNSDSLYVIPHNNTTLFEIYNDIPNANDPDSTYHPATSTSTAWAPLGIANSGDAIQVRMPDGTYFHGVSYGGSDISGGPDNTKIKTSGMGGENGYFNSGDFKDPNNWGVGTAPTDETPGTYNNAANEEWLRLMRDPTVATCPVIPLPITLVRFEGIHKNGDVELSWESSTEQNNNYFEILHSSTGYDFQSIGEIHGAGSVSHNIEYEYSHQRPINGINYYKLNSVDYDGTIHEKGIIAVPVEFNEVYYDNISKNILFPNQGDYSIYSVSGQLIKTVQGKSRCSFNENGGVYLVVNRNRGTSTKIIIQ